MDECIFVYKMMLCIPDNHGHMTRQVDSDNDDMQLAHMLQCFHPEAHWDLASNTWSAIWFVKASLLILIFSSFYVSIGLIYNYMCCLCRRHQWATTHMLDVIFFRPQIQNPRTLCLFCFWQGQGEFSMHIFIYLYIYIYISLYIHIYVYVCVYSHICCAF